MKEDVEHIVSFRQYLNQTDHSSLKSHDNDTYMRSGASSQAIQNDFHQARLATNPCKNVRSNVIKPRTCSSFSEHTLRQTGLPVHCNTTAVANVFGSSDVSIDDGSKQNDRKCHYLDNKTDYCDTTSVANVANSSDVSKKKCKQFGGDDSNQGDGIFRHHKNTVESAIGNSLVPSVTLVLPMPFAGINIQPSAENKRNLRISARLMRFCDGDSQLRQATLKKCRWTSRWKLSLVKSQTKTKTNRCRCAVLLLVAMGLALVLYCHWITIWIANCNDCNSSEVCISLRNDEEPSCKPIQEVSDKSGCGGYCTLGLESCQKVDPYSYRCVEDFACFDNEFRCTNQLCIPATKRCDGHMNCYDYTDEYECPCDLTTHQKCGNNTSCIPLAKRCNHVIDCWDGVDEENCRPAPACLANDSFTCEDGTCIHQMLYCDGASDCQDKSDEPFGCGGPCLNSEWRCDEQRCIPTGLVCDGNRDCIDGSDETDCDN